MGYPNTTGLPTMDYLLSDAVLDPPGEPKPYTEQVVRLPGCFCCYQPPPWMPPVSPLPACEKGYITFGSLNELSKINDSVIDLWSEVLRALPSAHLLLFRYTLKGATRERLLRRFSDRGIAPERVHAECLPGAQGRHLAVCERIDVLLDPFPWTGHVTTCEVLWMGVPVITWYGNRHAGRLSSTILKAIGLVECIARTPSAYVSTAVKLASDLERLAALRAGLRSRMQHSPLCDGQRLARRLEKAYRRMWRRWCAGARAASPVES